MVVWERDCPLLAHNTFGIEAKAAWLVTYDSADDLQEVVHRLHAEMDGMPVLHIGQGSNLLFLSDFNGVILHSNIRGIECTKLDDCVRLRVGAAELWDDFVAYCVSHRYYGAENLSLIPGEVGASAVQNIGAYGVEVADIIRKVETVDLQNGDIRTFDVAECGYSYRNSIFKGELRGRYAVTHVTYELSRHFVPRIGYGGIRDALRAQDVNPEQATAEDLRRIVISIRQDKLPDPKVLGNAGSFFMNPVVERAVYDRIRRDYPEVPHYEVDERHVKIPAGWLIEQCGWKGRSLGRAAVHHRQALVLVNKGGATGREVLALCDAVREDVLRKFGIAIRPEVNIIGGTEA